MYHSLIVEWACPACPPARGANSTGSSPAKRCGRAVRGVGAACLFVCLVFLSVCLFVRARERACVRVRVCREHVFVCAPAERVGACLYGGGLQAEDFLQAHLLLRRQLVQQGDPAAVQHRLRAGAGGILC